MTRRGLAALDKLVKTMADVNESSHAETVLRTLALP